LDTSYSKEDITLVFAKHKDYSAERIGRYVDIWQKECSNLVFGGVGDPIKLCPLQAADIIAYEVSREFRMAPNKPIKARYPWQRLLDGLKSRKGRFEVTVIINRTAPFA
jgi:hypothetical protein